MRTDDLITTLAADGPPLRPDLRRMFLTAVAGGWLAAAVLFMVLLGPRPDIATVAADPRFLLKFVVTLLLAATAVRLALRLAQPGAPAGAAAVALTAAPALLLAAVFVELSAVPSAHWTMRTVGTNALVCLFFVPLLAIPLLLSGLLALRGGAPVRPGATGAVAGLLAGGLAAALYASHCTDDSPLFVAVWYTLAIAIVVVAGAIAGRFLLRW